MKKNGRLCKNFSSTEHGHNQTKILTEVISEENASFIIDLYFLINA